MQRSGHSTFSPVCAKLKARPGVLDGLMPPYSFAEGLTGAGQPFFERPRRLHPAKRRAGLSTPARRAERCETFNSHY